MAAYGWTLEEALSITLPQMKELLGAIAKFPPAAILAPALLEAMGDKKRLESSGIKMTGAPISLDSVAGEVKSFLGGFH